MALDLSKQIGPLPLGAWIAIVGGGLAFAYYTSTHAAAPAAAPDPGVAAGYDAATPADTTDTTDTTGTGTTGITDNDSWGTAAVNALVARGYSATAAQTAISKYLSGGSPNLQDTALINLAILLIGAPPSLPQSNLPTTPNPGTGTTATFKGVSQATPGIPGKLGDYNLKAGSSRYDSHGKPVGKYTGKTAYIYQWGKIGSAWYGKSVTYYFRAADLTAQKSTVSVHKPPTKAAPKPPAKPQKPKAPAKPRAATYTVKPDDSLSAIAQRLGVKGGWKALYSANHKAIGSNPNLIYPGLKLKI